MGAQAHVYPELWQSDADGGDCCVFDVLLYTNAFYLGNNLAGKGLSEYAKDKRDHGNIQLREDVK